jgi:hypothetical protein
VATVGRLLYGRDGYGPSKRIHRDIAARLLRVGLDVADGARVDGTGTRRRLRALVAMGWSSRALGVRMGWPENYTGVLINVEGRTVMGGTARKVRDLYDELWDVSPPQDTTAQRATVSRARKRAQRRGWVSPLAWDDHSIDDPAARPSGCGGGGFDPATVLLLAAGGGDAAQAGAADRVAVVEALTAAGLSASQIAARLGVTPRWVVRLRAKAARREDAEVSS